MIQCQRGEKPCVTCQVPTDRAVVDERGECQRCAQVRLSRQEEQDLETRRRLRAAGAAPFGFAPISVTPLGGDAQPPSGGPT